MHVKPTARSIPLTIPFVGMGFVGLSAFAFHQITEFGRIEMQAELQVALAESIPEPRLGQEGALDPSDWLERTRDVWSGPECCKHDYDLRRELSRRQVDSVLEPAFAGLESCTGPGAIHDAVWRVRKMRERRDGIGEPPSCWREVMQLLLQERAEGIALGLESVRYAPVDSTERFGDPPQVVRDLQLAVLHAGWEKRSTDVVELLRAQRHVARMLDAVLDPWPVATWLDLIRLDTLEFALSRLGPGLDLRWLEEDLESIRPRERFVRSAHMERAEVDAEFEALRNRVPTPSMPPRDSVASRITLSYDHNQYLSRTAELTARGSESPFLRSDLVGSNWLSDALAPGAAYLLQRSVWTDWLDLTDQLEMRIGLARVALVAYRAGREAALAFARDSIDPFDGLPLRCDPSFDGTLRIWSVRTASTSSAGKARTSTSTTWSGTSDSRSARDESDPCRINQRGRADPVDEDLPRNACTVLHSAPRDFLATGPARVTSSNG